MHFETFFASNQVNRESGMKYLPKNAKSLDLTLATGQHSFLVKRVMVQGGDFSYGNGTNSFYRLNRHLDFDKVKKKKKFPTESETKAQMS